MCCIALFRCVLVLRCGSAGVVWYPYAGWSTSASAFSRFKNKIIFKKLIKTKYLAPVCYSLRAIIANSFFELLVEGKFCGSRKEKTNKVSIIDSQF